jgi:predicted alternative tryptophan synthase beta-subunit
MLTPENIAVLNELFLAYAKQTPTILGARLGDIVKKQFPEENIKKNYGSVLNFVSKHFSSILTHTGRHGVDNVYSFNPAIVGGGVQTTDCATAELGSSTEGAVEVAKVGVTTSQQPRFVQAAVSIAVLRAAIKESINLMSAEQLRQLSIPAGILLDAINRTNRL